MPAAKALALSVLAALVLAAYPARAAAQAGASRTGETPRTPWGDPDLQGTWPSGPLIDVPFERPPAFGTRAELTDAEFATRANELARLVENDEAASESPIGGAPTAPPQHWLERGEASRQASLVVDPPDGRLPPMTDDGQARADAWQRDNFTIYDRCVTRGVLGSAFPNIYGTGMQILQVPGMVVIRHEMIHETRVIPLDGRPHVPDAIRSYMGDPRGRWEGPTLVVETTNFNGKTGSYGRNGAGNPTSEALRLVERFTRVGADTLQYEVTVHDERTWTRPWTVAYPLRRDEGHALYEYGCHEGNYALVNMMKSARAAETAAAR